jgi:hypothetical protein
MSISDDDRTGRSPVNVTKESASIRIATWAPKRTQGGFSALTSGVLAVSDECLVLRTDREPLILVLPVGSYEWGSKTRILRYRGTQYSLGDVIKVSGGAFEYGSAIGAEASISWPDCGLTKGWLANR